MNILREKEKRELYNDLENRSFARRRSNEGMKSRTVFWKLYRTILQVYRASTLRRILGRTDGVSKRPMRHRTT